ncbi:MAG TPA: acyl carrier protein, partial [Kofleriaceae bacterium]|nr:acyl carrier protein [Kofleriaceae bacterium]
GRVRSRGGRSGDQGDRRHGHGTSPNGTSPNGTPAAIHVVEPLRTVPKTEPRAPIDRAPAADRAAIRAAVLRLIADILHLEDDEVDPAAALVELGADSIAAVEIARGVGERLGVQIEATELYDHPTADALARLVEERRVTASMRRAALASPAQPSAQIPLAGAALREHVANLSDAEVEALLGSLQNGVRA